MSAELASPIELGLKFRNLPAIPELVSDIICIVNDAKSSSLEVEAVVERDQAMAATLLRVANSAAYGLRRRVETIREAVVVLGRRKIGYIATTAASAGLFKGNSSPLLEPIRLWSHALATSIWARKIIESKRLWATDTAVTAALLHDIGILVLAQLSEERYTEVLEEARRRNSHHAVIEQRMLGLTHARVGAMLCVKWNLPVGVGQLIGQHHSCISPVDPAMAVLLVADFLSDTTGFAPFPWDVERPAPEGALQLLGLTLTECDQLLTEVDDVNAQTTALADVIQSDV